MLVLKGINFSRYNINVISIESNGYYDDSIIINYLKENGYSFIIKVCIDMIFKKN